MEGTEGGREREQEHFLTGKLASRVQCRERNKVINNLSLFLSGNAKGRHKRPCAM